MGLLDKSRKAASETKRADAFCNVDLVVTDADGNSSKLSLGGIPMNMSNKNQRTLMQFAKDNPDAVYKCVATVRFVDDDEESVHNVQLSLA